MSNPSFTNAQRIDDDFSGTVPPRERTWQDVLRWRPELGTALYVATSLKRRNPNFCANSVWHYVFDPLVQRAVGWHSRKAVCGVGHSYLLSDLTDGEDEPQGGHTDVCRARWAEQDWLRTSEAYDLAFRTIYAALPGCQHPSTWGCV